MEIWIQLQRFSSGQVGFWVGSVCPLTGQSTEGATRAVVGSLALVLRSLVCRERSEAEAHLADRIRRLLTSAHVSVPLHEPGQRLQQLQLVCLLPFSRFFIARRRFPDALESAGFSFDSELIPPWSLVDLSRVWTTATASSLPAPSTAFPDLLRAPCSKAAKSPWRTPVRTTRSTVALRHRAWTRACRSGMTTTRRRHRLPQDRRYRRRVRP